MEAAEAPAAVPADHPIKSEEQPDEPIALTPPHSGPGTDDKDRSSSELSDPAPLEEDDVGDVEPDHYWDGGRIPVFKPTMEQFKDFEKFVRKIDQYGMQSGIVKVIPPKEWSDALPALDEAIKTVRIKNPIRQEFAGAHGCYVQANIEKQRSYNLPQWKAVTEQSNHQPPARRGERRRGTDPPPRSRPTRSEKPPPSSDGAPRKRGRPRKHRAAPTPTPAPTEEKPAEDSDRPAAPPTPASPGADQEEEKKGASEEASKSVTSRRQNARRTEVDEIDEAAFKGFNYRMQGLEEFTPERCKELENVYWKTVPSALPMYGADMAGSLFDDRTDYWNVAKLPNLLDVLGTKVPGVNSTYCYFGMWKATFAWHLEDVDLYSINYIHFGAPKQWYSISQSDLKRFEVAMRSKWPNDHKHCHQFLRHKTYLMSPSLLESQFNIKVNKLVHYEGEFVITYPYGYHSGFNLGYNCAESVNFATESWLDYAKVAAKCECETDSVWVDPYEIERKLRGEPTPEYYEEEIEVEEDEDDDLNLPSPDSAAAGKAKSAGSKKRKRENGAKEGTVKRIKIIKKKAGPCVLCPHDVPFDKLLPTDNGKKAHRLCAMYTPETAVISTPQGGETVVGVIDIDKARLGLKCNHCHSKFGACFQCSAKKCTRSYHATCAAEAGVLVDQGPVPVFDEDGTEYYYDGFDFRCRWHRPKRTKDPNISNYLESRKHIQEYSQSLQPRDVVQAQYSRSDVHGEIFCGVVLENRPSEMAVLLDVLPSHNHVEVEWKWLLALDPAESQRPKPSEKAVPVPEHLKNEDLNTKSKDGPPEVDEPFSDPNLPEKWAEFHGANDVKFAPLAKVDLEKANQLWHYLGKTSTEAKAQYTDDVKNSKHNPKSNFLDTVKPPPPPRKPTYPSTFNVRMANVTQGYPGRPSYPAQFHPHQPRPAPPGEVTHAQFPSASYAPSVNSRSGWVDPRLQPQPQPYPRPPQPIWPAYGIPPGGLQHGSPPIANQNRPSSYSSKGDRESQAAKSNGASNPPVTTTPNGSTHGTPVTGSRPAASPKPSPVQGSPTTWSPSPGAQPVPAYSGYQNAPPGMTGNYAGPYMPQKPSHGYAAYYPGQPWTQLAYHWPQPYNHGHNPSQGQRPGSVVTPPSVSQPQNGASKPPTSASPKTSWQPPYTGPPTAKKKTGGAAAHSPVRPNISPLSDAGENKPTDRGDT